MKQSLTHTYPPLLPEFTSQSFQPTAWLHMRKCEKIWRNISECEVKHSYNRDMQQYIATDPPNEENIEHAYIQKLMLPLSIFKEQCCHVRYHCCSLNFHSSFAAGFIDESFTRWGGGGIVDSSSWPMRGCSAFLLPINWFSINCYHSNPKCSIWRVQ